MLKPTSLLLNEEITNGLYDKLSLQYDLIQKIGVGTQFQRTLIENSIVLHDYQKRLKEDPIFYFIETGQFDELRDFMQTYTNADPKILKLARLYEKTREAYLKQTQMQLAWQPPIPQVKTEALYDKPTFAQAFNDLLDSSIAYEKEYQHYVTLVDRYYTTQIQNYQNATRSQSFLALSQEIEAYYGTVPCPEELQTYQGTMPTALQALLTKPEESFNQEDTKQLLTYLYHLQKLDDAYETAITNHPTDDPEEQLQRLEQLKERRIVRNQVIEKANHLQAHQKIPEPLRANLHRLATENTQNFENIIETEATFKPQVEQQKAVVDECIEKNKTKLLNSTYCLREELQALQNECREPLERQRLNQILAQIDTFENTIPPLTHRKDLMSTLSQYHQRFEQLEASQPQGQASEMHTQINNKIKKIQLTLLTEIETLAPKAANEPATLSQPQTPVAPLQRANEIPRTTPVSQQPNTFFASPKEGPAEKTGHFRNSLQELKNGNGASHDNHELSKLADKALAEIETVREKIERSGDDALLSSVATIQEFCATLKTNPEQVEPEAIRHILSLADSLTKENEDFEDIKDALEEIQKAQFSAPSTSTANVNPH